MAITFHPLGQFSLTAAAAFAEDFPGTISACCQRRSGMLTLIVPG
jgi:hypothetical protein